MRTDRQEKRRTGVFLAITVLTALLSALSSGGFPFRNVSSYLYGGLVIAWGLTIQRRVVHPRVSRLLTGGASCLLLLFVLRACRWHFFSFSEGAQEVLHGAYYLPMVTVPLLSLLATLCIGKSGPEQPFRPAQWLWVPWAALCTAALTNPLHHALVRPGENGAVVHGWLYTVVVAWCVILSLASFGIMMRRCRVSACRKKWYLPALAAAAGTVLLTIYFLAGGAPKAGGVDLYQMQEAYAFLYISLWESCIRIGLIPSNTNYDRIFLRSPWNAVITDRSGEAVYRSASASVPGAEALRAALSHPTEIDEDHLLHGQTIRGGAVYWVEDVSRIRAINERLSDAIEYLEEENDLLEEENRIRAQHAAYELQNKLYDSVSQVVQPQLTQAAELLSRKEEREEDFRRSLLSGMLLCVYVKRRVNLSLLAHGQKSLPVHELLIALRETAEYLSLGGIPAEADLERSISLPAEKLLLAYDFIEAVLEAARPGLSAFLVNVRTAEGLRLNINMETPTALPPENWRFRQMQRLGARVETVRDGESVFLRLVFEKEAERDG